MTISLIAIAISLAFWHLIYEGLLAPTRRSALQHRIFELRDQLRQIKIENKETDPEVFQVMQNSLNIAIRSLRHLRLSNLVAARNAAESDTELKQAIQRELKIIEECPDERIRDINDKLVRLAEQALFINMGGWLIWVLPAAIALLSFAAIRKQIDSLLKFPEYEAGLIRFPDRNYTQLT